MLRGSVDVKMYSEMKATHPERKSIVEKVALNEAYLA